MPLHSIEPLPGGLWLGRWHLRETPADLWPRLPPALAAAYAPLLPARRAGPRQAQWLAGRVLLPELLAAAGAPAGLHLANDPTGRPYLTGADAGPVPAVALSHAGEWVTALLAPPGARAGLDVEQVRDQARRLAPKFLSEAERAALGSDAGPDAYTLLWSAKETLFKLAGRAGVIFKEHLLLDLPAGPWPPAGALPARLCRPGQPASRHSICYFRPAAGYWLTYCVA